MLRAQVKGSDERPFENSLAGGSSVLTGWLNAIARYKQTNRRCAAGCQLFRPGESRQEIIEILEGWAFLYVLFADGSRQILSFVLPGAIVGFHPAQDDVPTYGLEALTDVSFAPYLVSSSTLYERHPEIGMRLAWLLSRDLSLAFDHLAIVGRLSARERVAHLLLELFVRERLRWPGHRVEDVYLPVTQEHLADATGLTGVHVNRMLRNLKKQGIIEFQYHRLRILDPDKLLDVAALDPLILRSWLRSHEVG